MVQAQIYFKGTVQGVGFRYTCQRFALDLGLKGWVKNLADGRVEVLAQGDKDDLEALLDNLKNHFGGYIHDVQKIYKQMSREFEDFKIAY